MGKIGSNTRAAGSSILEIVDPWQLSAALVSLQIALAQLNKGRYLNLNSFIIASCLHWLPG